MFQDISELEIQDANFIMITQLPIFIILLKVEVWLMLSFFLVEMDLVKVQLQRHLVNSKGTANQLFKQLI